MGRIAPDGKEFEAAFRTMANLCGLKVIKVPEMGQWIDRYTFRARPGWTDFMLVGQDGRTAFVDTKTTMSENFAHSKINQHQVDFMRTVGDLCAAGYVVNFVPFNSVVFFGWQSLAALQPGQSLSPEDGLLLGKVPQVQVQGIMGSVTRGEVA